MDLESPSEAKYCTPCFSTDLHLLLLDNNTFSVMSLSSLLKQYAFQVTATDEVSKAMSIISNHERQFRLVMVKLNMPSTHDLAFLDLLHEKKIPVVFISYGVLEDARLKTLAKGSCYFVKEPIGFEEIKYLWLIAYRSKPESVKEAQYAKKVTITTQDHACGEKEEGKKIDTNHDANESKQEEDKREELKENKRKRKHTKTELPKKKYMIWTPELLLKFTDALDYLGGPDGNTARPKAIQKLMKVPDLTLIQIASHLQKHRLQLRRGKVTSYHGSSSNSSGKTMVPSSLQAVEQEEEDMHESPNQPTAEFAAPFADPLNASPKKDLNHAAETHQESDDIHKLQSVLSNPSDIANEISTTLVSQIDYGAVVRNTFLLPDLSSALQNLPRAEYEDFFTELEEDIDIHNFGSFRKAR